jgi:CelD/BcsL family acetyltransferase involved in cellulose biosynthesis
LRCPTTYEIRTNCTGIETLIDIHRVTSLDDIDSADWNNLLSSSTINEPFITYEWVRCWWKSFAANRDLFALIALQENRLVGIAPLMAGFEGRGLMRRSVIEFLGTGESDYCDFIIRSDDKETVLRAFFEYIDSQIDRWSVIRLCNVPEYSDTVFVLERILAEKPYRFQKRTSFMCPTLLIQKDPSFAKQCTRKKSLKRHFNYFDKAGQLTFRKLTTKEEIIESLDDFFQQHIERRAIAGGLSKFEDSRVRGFYRCLVTRL